jgi:methionyl-tRNA formyltransferase
MNTRIVFMGSPDFALPSLQALYEKFQVVGVVTQPDRPAGRGREFTPPPIKILADELGIPTIQPKNLKIIEAQEKLHLWNPDMIIVAAFGQILRSEVLNLPKFGCINVHASLLPRWRGAAPIQAAILNGDNKTGITIMVMDSGIDTGRILTQTETRIRSDETAGLISSRLAISGAKLLIDTIPGYIHGEIKPQSQDDSLATYAPMLKKKDGLMDFTQTAEYLERQVRAYNPWPSTYFFWKDKRLKVSSAAVCSDEYQNKINLVPGNRMVCSGYPAVQTAHGALQLLQVQPAGKKSMSGKVFLQGANDWV